MHYSEACTYLNELQFFKIKLGLEAVSNLLRKLGSPHTTFPTVHLAGTNGKGSVGATLLSLLSHNGYKVGFYSSPHLSSVRERFCINGEPIDRHSFAELATTIRDTLGTQHITYFEFTTALAFLWFQQQGVDIAIIETGLGGRLDATNVITPLVSVITTIDLDHQEYLGNTLTQIAGEKAGIIKNTVPVLSGVQDHTAQQVIKATCLQKQSPLYTLGVDFTCQSITPTVFTYTGINGVQFKGLHSALQGKHQQTNTCLALATAELLQQKGFHLAEEKIAEALQKTSWPGRMETVVSGDGQDKRHFLLDGAHNEAGIQALNYTLQDSFNGKKIILIWGSMADKDLGPAWLALLEKVSVIVLTQAETTRSATAEQLEERVPKHYHSKVRCKTEVDNALGYAAAHTTPEDLILIAGSLYLVGKTRELLLGKNTL